LAGVLLLLPLEIRVGGLSARNFPEKQAQENRENDEPWRETRVAS